MNWLEKYKDKEMTADEAIAKYVKSGDSVFLGSGSPARQLCGALFDAVEAGKLTGISGDGALFLNNVKLNERNIKPEQLRYKSNFFGGYEHAGVLSAKTSYIPLLYSNLGRYYEMVRPNVVFAVLTPPDEEGYCNASCIASGQLPDLFKYGKTILAELTPNQPRVCGIDNTIHINDIAAFMMSDEPCPVLPPVGPTPEEQKISNFILNHVSNGACIQLGIGGMPNALGYGLKSLKDIGIHSEMLSASMVELMKEGVINNSRKNFMPGVATCTFVLGEQSNYDYVDNNNPDFCFLPYSILNDPINIGANDNFISVNNALEIDLTGATCSDTIGFKQYSGVGGQIDFVRGATISKGGKSFIALNSTYTDKQGQMKSHIVLDLAPGAQTTTLRSEIMYVVTEYGCVNLWGQDVPTRVKLLVSIAHPDFRDELTFQAKKAGLLY